MSGKKEIVKGRFAETAGAPTGNDEHRDKGGADRAPGQVMKTDPEFGHVKQNSKKVIDRGSKRMHS